MIDHTPLRGLLLVLLLLAGAIPSAAQEREGFWGSVGFGAATVDLSVSPDSLILLNAGEDWGGVAEFAAGWALNQRLLAGVEMSFASGTLGRGVDIVLSQVSGVGLFYPSRSNFFIKGGAGLAVFEADVFDVPGLPSATGTALGFGVTAGAGYDFYIGRGFSITPAGGFWFGRPGDLEQNGRTVFSGWSQRVLDLTVALKFS